ncbi:MAG: recombinase family protein [Acidobacteriota bacterium]
MRAVLYHRVSDGHRDGRRPETLEAGLARLHCHAESRGWTVVDTITDQQATPGQARPGFERLVQLVREAPPAVDVVATLQLVRLFLDPGTAAYHLGIWLARTPPLHLVALGDGLDSTRALDLAGWRGLLRPLAEMAREIPRERAVAAAYHRLAGRAGAGPSETAAWDVIRIRQLYAAGLSQRAMAKALSTPDLRVAQSSLNRVLRTLRERDELDEEARARSLAKRPHSKGGRPPTQRPKTQQPESGAHKPDPRGRQRS